MYATGRAWNDDNLADIYTVKLAAADGAVVWDDLYGGGARLDDIGWDVVVGPDGNPVVGGLVSGEGGAAFWFTAKLDSADGHHLWSWEQPGAMDNLQTRSLWLVPLPGGDVLLVSRTWSAESGFDVVVQRQAAADGWPVYTETYDAGGGVADDPRDAMLAADGTLLVCGVTDGDYMAVKLDPADAHEIWRSTYAGPPDWYDVATCITVAPGGEIVVSGYSDGDGTGWDVATVGFASADGAFLWDVRWTSSLPWGSEEARDVVTGPLGDIYVVGYTYSEGGDQDMLSLRYVMDSLVSVDEPAVPGRVASLRAWPNPFNPRVNLAYTLPAAGRIGVTVHDLAGREVAVLADGQRSAGEHRLAWDGRDDAGRMLPAGVYLVRVVTSDGDAAALQKVVLAK